MAKMDGKKSYWKSSTVTACPPISGEPEQIQMETLSAKP
ncbi:hypothetical protein AVEN_48344-1, partial [Araneus ventricosus]